MAAETRVAVVGINGTLGAPVIKSLIRTSFDLTLLTRDKNKTQQFVESTFPSSERLHITEVDYTSNSSLVSALTGQHSVIILISRTVADPHIKVIDAAIEAGVEQIIPSCFGLDTRIPSIRANPALEQKLRMEDHVLHRAEDKSKKWSYAMIHTAVFLEWSLTAGVFINTQGDGDAPTMVFDDGDSKIGLSSFNDIGTAIVNVIRKRHSPEVRDKVLLMSSVHTTQNDLLAYARGLRPDKTWPTIRIDSADAMRKSQEALARGDRTPPAMSGFLVRAYSADGSGWFPKLDNDVLGVSLKDETFLKDALRDALQA
ncbi:hypothetical protein B0A52_01989 [Exophiala mesophila]|uniref:NmrA-like domain-containing protein n=1 Tax=Exophiala mesophila TaxID=212818 RepID=A0A438NEK7_EXOME|nr:hypothetical protein B0A52_01989 [Exophiala mesophila]